MSENDPSTARPSSAHAPPGRPALFRKGEATRADILGAAARFLEGRPFRDLTVGGLMAGTPHSRPTFYLYFDDLHELMATLLDGVRGDIVSGAQAWLEDEGNSAVSLRQSLRALVQVGHAHGAILRAVSDAAPSDVRLEGAWEAFLEAFDHIVATRIARDQAKGLTPRTDPLHLARALNRMDAAMLIRAFGSDPKEDRETVLAALEHVWLSAVYPSAAPPTRDERPL